MKRKVAILISGLVRNFDNYENIKKNLIECNPNYEFDIFIGLWNNNIINISKTIDTGIENVLQNINTDEVIKKYNPLSYIILDVVKEHTMFKKNIINKLLNHYVLINAPTLYHPLLSQLYCIYKTFEKYNEFIIQNNVKYDMVIRYRFDLFTSKPIILDTADNMNVYAIQRPPYFPDWLFIGSHENMKFIFNSYEYYVQCIFDKKINIPELIFKTSCNIHKINISYTLTDTFYLNKKCFELSSVDYKKWNGLT
jgi:hypothetical protein